MRNKPIKYQKVKRDEKYALMAGIAVWIEDNQEIVGIAQKLSAITINLGLCDTSAHMPFQIVPQDMFDANGNLFYELFMNIDHAAWGYFRLNIVNPTEYELISPKTAPWPQTKFSSQQEVSDFLCQLGATLDPLYDLEDAVEARKHSKINEILASLLAAYRAEIDPKLAAIRQRIDAEPMARIVDTNSGAEQFASESEFRYDLALSHPDNWYVARERTPEEMEKVNSINEKLDKNVLQLQKYAAVDDETEKLRDDIREFFIAESKAAAFLYAAQRTLAQNGYQTEVATDSADGEPDATNYVLIHKVTNMVYVRPVLHATEVHIVDGPNPKTKKPKDFGIPIIE